MTELEKKFKDEKYASADPAFIEKYDVPGIYAIMLDDEVVYVGKSTKMFNRWTAHQANALVPDARDYNTFKYSQLRKAKQEGRKLTFTVLEFCPVCALDRLEAHYIKMYRPKLNRQVPRADGKGFTNKGVQPIV